MYNRTHIMYFFLIILVIIRIELKEQMKFSRPELKMLPSENSLIPRESCKWIETPKRMLIAF